MIKISESELEVMKILWKNNEPISAYSIRKELSNLKGWERTTILTLIRRLVEKKAITQEKKDVYYYSSNITEQDYMHCETQNFINRVYDGNYKTLITSLVQNEDLNNSDISELKDFFNKRS